MADTSPTPSTPQAPAPGAPLVDPNALVATFMAVLKTPAEFFKSIKGETGFQKCLVFSVAMFVVQGVLLLLWQLVYYHSFGAGIGSLVQATITGFIGPFIGGLILWVICMVLGSKAPYDPSVRIAAYSSAVAPVAGACMLVPWIGWIGALAAFVYGIYVVVLGAKALNFEQPPVASQPPA